MAYYWLYFKNAQGRVEHAFLLEHEGDAAVLGEAAKINRGHLDLEIWEDERLVARLAPRAGVLAGA